VKLYQKSKITYSLIQKLIID